jgi:hypothetical protein
LLSDLLNGLFLLASVPAGLPVPFLEFSSILNLPVIIVLLIHFFNILHIIANTLTITLFAKVKAGVILSSQPSPLHFFDLFLRITPIFDDLKPLALRYLFSIANLLALALADAELFDKLVRVIGLRLDPLGHFPLLYQAVVNVSFIDNWGRKASLVMLLGHILNDLLNSLVTVFIFVPLLIHLGEYLVFLLRAGNDLVDLVVIWNLTLTILTIIIHIVFANEVFEALLAFIV